MASTVMARPDEGRMHRLALHVASSAMTGFHEHMAKTDHKVVAVERHDCDWRDGCKMTEERFLWFKARDKTPVRQIKSFYRSHYDVANLEVTLSVHQQQVDDSKFLADLDSFHDKFIVFTTQSPLPAPLAPPPSSQLFVPEHRSNLMLGLSSAPSYSDESGISRRTIGSASLTQSTSTASVLLGGNESRTVVHTALKELLTERTPERLEYAVQKGLATLKEIEQHLYTLSKDPDARKWLVTVAEVREMASKNRTVIGVSGNTGAGKSSVINAVLEEERLVPTNCMRACTAVVTEMCYNESSDPSTPYRAEIEFVQPDDWRRELAILFEEVFDGAGSINKDVHNSESIAGVAYAKMRAVYHNHTREMLQSSNINQLMATKSVIDVLGTVKRISSGDCASFYQRLQHYVDSKQKPGSDLHVKNAQKREFELWPLIKVVRIYTKAEALSTGAVLVDLPGVHDSNAARAAVADSYMKECTGLWIVAPITRAVDDKAAKNLLGNSFKRQLKYDGTYSAVTFICSKTDDISRTEAIDSLHLDARMAGLLGERSEIDRRKLEINEEHARLRNDRESNDDEMHKYEEQIDHLDDELSNISIGNMPCETGAPTNKRKYAIEAEEAGLTDGVPLTVQQKHDRIESLKQLKRTARQNGQRLREKMEQIQRQLVDLEARKVEVDASLDAFCIEGRNEWSRARIREDFAEGIKELDQENAAQENPEEFDPDRDVRDYEDVARSLPVFCVSSRAYQKLSGRLQHDGEVVGFSSKSQTEIPQLQAHCRKLTEGGRQAGCTRFLNRLNQLLTSLSLWASDDMSDSSVDSQQRISFKSSLAKNLLQFERGLEVGVDQTMDDVVEILEAQLFGEFAAAANAAASAADSTVSSWGAPMENGGLFWATYKATVRRKGIFAGSSGTRNFNVELTEPLYKGLSTPWDQAFHRRLPAVIQSFSIGAVTTLRQFHDAVESDCKEYGLGVSRVARLKDNIIVFENAFEELSKAMIINVNEAQREINREFTPSVASAMDPVYTVCGAENGKRPSQHNLFENH